MSGGPVDDVSWGLANYVGPDGRKPFIEWVRDISDVKRAAVLTAVRYPLRQFGPDVIEIGMGRNVGKGVFEFYVEHTADEIASRFADAEPPVKGPPEEVWLRVFCHAYGNRQIALLGGFDKGRHGEEAQQRAILRAQRLVSELKRR